MRSGFSRAVYLSLSVVALLGVSLVIFVAKRTSDVTSSEDRVSAPAEAHGYVQPAVGRRSLSAARLTRNWLGRDTADFTAGGDFTAVPWAVGESASTGLIFGQAGWPSLAAQSLQAGWSSNVASTDTFWSSGYAGNVNLATALPLFGSMGGSAAPGGGVTLGLAGIGDTNHFLATASAGGAASGGGGAGGRGLAVSRWSTETYLGGTPVGLLAMDPAFIAADLGTDSAAAVTPLPAAVWGGLALLACLGAAKRVRTNRSGADLQV